MELTVNLTEEQKKELKKRFKEVIEPVIEYIEDIMKTFKDWLKEIWTNLKLFIEKSIEYKKCINIYNRTHSQRIKKKQISKIIKLFKEEMQC